MGLSEHPARVILKETIDWLGERHKYYTELKKSSVKPEVEAVSLDPAGDKKDGLYCLSASGSMKLLKSGINQLLTVLDNLGIWCAYKVRPLLFS